MLACFLEGKGKTIVKEVPIPALSNGDFLIKMQASGICGTDLEKISGQLGAGEGVLGHEVSGTIDTVEGELEGFEPGDRVVAHHHVPCNRCSYCLRGDPTMCNEFRKTNLDPCGFAEYFRVPKYNIARGSILHLPNDITLEEGAMIEPTACAIRAIRKARVAPNDNVLVVGLGPTGLTQVQLLRSQTSGKIIGTDIIESRLQAGRRWGADETVNALSEDVGGVCRKLTTDGVDLAVIATGNEKGFDQAFSSIRKGATIMLFGAPADGASYRLDVSQLFSRQVSLMTSYSCIEAEMHEAIALVSKKLLDLKSLITDRFRLREADKAFIHAKASNSAIKTMIMP